MNNLVLRPNFFEQNGGCSKEVLLYFIYLFWSVLLICYNHLISSSLSFLISQCYRWS